MPVGGHYFAADYLEEWPDIVGWLFVLGRYDYG